MLQKDVKVQACIGKRFQLALLFSLAIFIPIGLADVLITLFREKYLYFELGDKLAYIGYATLLYSAIAAFVAMVFTIVQSVILKRICSIAQNCVAVNWAMILSTVIFLPMAWVYNRVISKLWWTNPKSLGITGFLFIISIVLGIVIYRIMKGFKWRRTIAISRPRTFMMLFGFFAFLLVLGQINFVRFFRLIGSPNKPNIILLSIDTLSAEHMSCYDYEQPTTPEMAKIAKEGVLFKHCVSQASWTLPAHTTMFTSLYPSMHGMTKFGTYLDDSFTTVAEVLHQGGYRTGAFVDSDKDFIVGTGYGYGQGFDFYNHQPGNMTRAERLGIGKLVQSLIQPVDPSFFYYKIHSKEKTDDIFSMALHWMSRYNRKQPFFLFLHTYDVHATSWMEIPYWSPDPYQNLFCSEYASSFTGCNANRTSCGTEYLRKLNKKLCSGEIESEPLSEEDVKYLIDLYDGGVSFVDSWVGKLIDGIKRMGLGENTLVIVTSDHGEEFMEHNQFQHVQYYEEVIHVPMIIWFGGNIAQEQEIDELATHLDIMPTILDLVDLSTDAPMQGVSLWPLISGQTDTLERSYVFCGDDREIYAGLARFDTEKFIANGENQAKCTYRNTVYEYYDLQNDPKELTNLCITQNICPENYKELVETWRARCDSMNQELWSGVDQQVKKMTKSMKRKLRALGYID